MSPSTRIILGYDPSFEELFLAQQKKFPLVKDYIFIRYFDIGDTESAGSPNAEAIIKRARTFIAAFNAEMIKIVDEFGTK